MPQGPDLEHQGVGIPAALLEMDAHVDSCGMLTFPVSISHSKPSGRGSSLALGSCSCDSILGTVHQIVNQGRKIILEPFKLWQHTRRWTSDCLHVQSMHC